MDKGEAHKKRGNDYREIMSYQLWNSCYVTLDPEVL